MFAGIDGPNPLVFSPLAVSVGADVVVDSGTFGPRGGGRGGQVCNRGPAGLRRALVRLMDALVPVGAAQKTRTGMMMMTSLVGRASAVAFLLWGLLHMVGGGAMLAALTTDGPAGYLNLVATGASAGVHDSVSDGTASILAYHAFNLLFIGAVVAALAAGVQWRGHVWGFVLNAAVVTGVDAGLLLFMVMPGSMRFSDALPGAVLWLVGVSLGVFAARDPGDDPAPATATSPA